jgi:hypothetical protein
MTAFNPSAPGLMYQERSIDLVFSLALHHNNCRTAPGARRIFFTSFT